MLRLFLKDSLIYLAPNLISRSLSLLLLPIYTRLISTADYGALDLIGVLGSLICLTVAMEIHQGVARFIPENSDPIVRAKQISTGLWFCVLVYGLTTLAGLSLSSKLVGPLIGDDIYTRELQIGLIWIGVYGCFLYSHGLFRWLLKAKTYSLIAVLHVAATAGISVYLAAVANMGLYGILWGKLAGAIIGLVASLIGLREYLRLSVHFDLLKKFLKFSAPLVPSSASVFVVQYFDRIMISHLVNLDELGVYSVGARLATAVTIVSYGVRSALTPLIYKHHEEQDTPQNIAKIFNLYILLSILVFSIMGLFAKEIILLTTSGGAYFNADNVILILVPGVIVASLYLFTPGLALAKKTTMILYANFAGATANIILNAALIPVFGIEGAALATSLSFLSVFLLQYMWSQREYRIRFSWSYVLVGFLVAFAGVVPSVIWELSLWIRALVFLAVAALAALLLPDKKALWRSLT